MVKFFEEDDRCIRINSEKNVDEVYEALEKEFTNKKLIKWELHKLKKKYKKT